MPIPASTKARLSAFFKERYPDRKLLNQAERDKPFLKAIKKKDDLEGDGIHVPVDYALAGGGSSDFQVAQRNGHGSKGVRFFISQNEYYEFVTLQALALRASRSKMGAYLKVKAKEVDSHTEAVGQHLARVLWGTGSGSIGQVSSGYSSGNSFTLAEPADAINFHEDMRLQAATNETTGSLLDGGAEVIVSKVNYGTGEITLSDVSLMPNFAASVYLFPSGNRNAQLTGVGGYIPSSDPSSGESFMTNVDRSVNPTALAGWRQSWKGTIEQTVKELNAKMKRFKTGDRTMFLSFDNWQRFEFEAGAKAIRDYDGPMAKMGFRTLGLPIAGGTIEIVADPFIGEDVGYLLQMDTWELHHLDGLPHIVMDDGQSAVRGANYDGIEMRIRYWAELVCTAPGRNGRFAIG